MFGNVSFPFRSDCEDYMAQQTTEEENQPGWVKPVQGWWQGWVFSSLQGLLWDAREVHGQEGFVHLGHKEVHLGHKEVICTSQKQNLWMITDTFGLHMDGFSAEKIPISISGDVGS